VCGWFAAGGRVCVGCGSAVEPAGLAELRPVVTRWWRVARCSTLPHWTSSTVRSRSRRPLHRRLRRTQVCAPPFLVASATHATGVRACRPSHSRRQSQFVLTRAARSLWGRTPRRRARLGVVQQGVIRCVRVCRRCACAERPVSGGAVRAPTSARGTGAPRQGGGADAIATDDGPAGPARSSRGGAVRCVTAAFSLRAPAPLRCPRVPVRHAALLRCVVQRRWSWRPRRPWPWPWRWSPVPRSRVRPPLRHWPRP
jgi:hypothetical protein